ncbi:hypothetical protein K470DRAFT_273791 [Piedraia hortae CBS 480.64]|uniref:Uncharacterized protein n=1 Tax=Piedraia hortae CBS 480.64 TaxID=1314780 RepID=A0A6A7CBA6_9PEZI|nr:hypothetical protein K470DRAFT_273791 [Piedraia hortae CBS 480.64]
MLDPTTSPASEPHRVSWNEIKRVFHMPRSSISSTTSSSRDVSPKKGSSPMRNASRSLRSRTSRANVLQSEGQSARKSSFASLRLFTAFQERRAESGDESGNAKGGGFGGEEGLNEEEGGEVGIPTVEKVENLLPMAPPTKIPDFRPQGLNCQKCYYFTREDCKGYIIGGQPGDVCEPCLDAGRFGDGFD